MSYVDPNAPTERDVVPSEVRYDQYGRPLQPVEPPQYAEPVRPVERVEHVHYAPAAEPVVPVDYDHPVAPVAPGEPLVPASRAWDVYRASQLVYLVFGVIEALILVRVILRLLGANAAAGFTSLIYGLTAPFVAPFAGVFPSTGAGGSVLELSSVLAIIIYALLAWVIVRVIHIAAERNQPPVRM
jgi:hypothetical protein